MSLQTYNKKRHFKKTPEPAGKAISRKQTRSKGKALRFVIQKHHASQLHYDFRLEMAGVLKSWAVPKGPSLNPKDKHLAMMVEDHPYDYRNFEGVIPEGNYGAGNVIIWDEGVYEALGPLPEGMTEEAYLLDQVQKGSLKIVMYGEKLKGEFALVRFKRAGDKSWLLIKHNDEYASQHDILAKDTSVRSGLRVEEVGLKKAARKEKILQKKAAKQEKEIVKKTHEKGVKSPFPEDISPMLAEVADVPFNNANWLFELKWDGYRAIAEMKKGKVRLYSRHHLDFNEKYPVVADALSKLAHDAVLDGEIVVLDDAGRSQFQLLQDYHRRKTGKLVYYVFDLLYLDGYDLRALPLLERKKYLQKILKESDVIKYNDHVEEHGLKLYAIAKRKGFEGVMAKQKNSKYVSRRSTDWLKIKNIQTQEAIICGFTQPKGKREDFGALILGIYDNNELRYVGHAGGGFDQHKLKEVYALLEPLIIPKSPFPIEPKTNTVANWIKPKLVCQVKFSEWTNEGVMRHPVFLGLRDDKKPEEVRDEGSPAKKKVKASSLPISRGKAQLTNLTKIYWPDEGYTKGDLIDYYEKIADYILPYLKDRPLSLNRFPNGIKGESFFQKDIIQKPDWVRTVPLYSEHDQHEINWLVCNNKDTLLYIANLGSIEIHPWNSRYQHPENPDYMIIDLDPEGIPFKEVIRTAKYVKELLDAADIDSFLKTSGKTGLHILVPLQAKYSYEQTKQFAQIIANQVFAKLPDSTSVVRNPKKREHKLYVDFLQNREGQTIAAPYSLRPVPKAPVSTPLDWKELTDDLHPTDFTIETIFSRLKKKGDIWEAFRKHRGINMLRSLEKLTIN